MEAYSGRPFLGLLTKAEEWSMFCVPLQIVGRGSCHFCPVVAKYGTYNTSIISLKYIVENYMPLSFPYLCKFQYSMQI